MMCSWRFGPAWLHEDHLVDADRLVAPQRSSTCSGVPIAPRSEPRPCCMILTASGAASGVIRSAREAALVAVREELLPDVRAPGPVAAHPVVVGQRVAEEVGAVDATLDRRGLVLVRASSAPPRPRRVDVESDRHAARPRRSARSTRSTQRPASSGSTNENDERSDPVAGGELDRLAPAAGHRTSADAAAGAASDTHVPRRHAEELAVPARERLLDEHAARSRPSRPPTSRASAVRSTRKPPSSAAELDSPVRRTRRARRRSGRAWRRARRPAPGGSPAAGSWTMPCPSRIALGAHRGGGEEDLGRRSVRVLLEEVVLDLPYVVEADPLRQLDLLQGVLQELRGRVRAPETRSRCSRGTAARAPRARVLRCS